MPTLVPATDYDGERTAFADTVVRDLISFFVRNSAAHGAFILPAGTTPNQIRASITEPPELEAKLGEVFDLAAAQLGFQRQDPGAFMLDGEGPSGGVYGSPHPTTDAALECLLALVQRKDRRGWRWTITRRSDGAVMGTFTS